MRIHALVALLALAACDAGSVLPSNPGDCLDHKSAVVALPQTGSQPSLQLATFKCRMDPQACNDLCTLALAVIGVTDPPTSCSVAFDANVLVGVSYDHQRTDIACPIAGGAPGTGPGSGGGGL